MGTGRAARGPARAGAGRAGPENPGPRAVRAETGLKTFIESFSIKQKIQIFVNVLQILIKIS